MGGTLSRVLPAQSSQPPIAQTPASQAPGQLPLDVQAIVDAGLHEDVLEPVASSSTRSLPTLEEAVRQVKRAVGWTSDRETDVEREVKSVLGKRAAPVIECVFMNLLAKEGTLSDVFLTTVGLTQTWTTAPTRALRQTTLQTKRAPVRRRPGDGPSLPPSRLWTRTNTKRSSSPRPASPLSPRRTNRRPATCYQRSNPCPSTSIFSPSASSRASSTPSWSSAPTPLATSASSKRAHSSPAQTDLSWASSLRLLAPSPSLVTLSASPPAIRRSNSVKAQKCFTRQTIATPRFCSRMT
jgi:hypothetical protein